MLRLLSVLRPGTWSDGADDLVIGEVIAVPVKMGSKITGCGGDTGPDAELQRPAKGLRNYYQIGPIPRPARVGLGSREAAAVLPL